MKKFFVLSLVLSSIVPSLCFAASSGPAKGPVYKNNKYGIQVELNKGWKGYTVRETPAKNKGAVLQFNVPGIEVAKGQLVEVMAITATPVVLYKTKKEFLEADPLMSYVGKNKKYYFTYNHTQDGAGIPSALLLESLKVPKVKLY